MAACFSKCACLMVYYWSAFGPEWVKNYNQYMYVFLVMLAFRISHPLTCGPVVTFKICYYSHLGVSVTAVFLTTLTVGCVTRVVCWIFTCKIPALCNQETGENAFDSRIYWCTESPLISATKYIQLGRLLVVRKHGVRRLSHPVCCCVLGVYGPSGWCRSSITGLLGCKSYCLSGRISKHIGSVIPVKNWIVSAFWAVRGERIEACLTR